MQTTVTPEMIDQYTRAGYWSTETYPTYLDRHAREVPDQPSIIASEGTLSHSQVREAASRLAAGLLRLGVRPGDRMAVQLTNRTEFILMRYAIPMLGALFIPIPVDWGRKEVAYVLAATGASCLILQARHKGKDLLAAALELKPGLPDLKWLILTERGPVTGRAPNLLLFESLLHREANLPMFPQDANRVDTIITSSGSTALPKLIMRTPNAFLTTARYFVERMAMTSHDKVLSIAPITRGMGFWISVAAPAVSGAATILQDSFEAEATWQLAARTKATMATAVPTQIIKMLEASSFRTLDLSAFRFMVVGGAPLPAEVAREWEKATGITIVNAYGATEGAVPTMTAPGDSPQKRYTTVGRPFPGVRVAILHESGAELDSGQVGEICYRGPNMSVGLWQDPAGYAQFFDDKGWFHSGDLGSMDQDGFVLVEGRKKEMIIRAGINISPKEIEEALQRHPQVKLAAIVKMPDRVTGEKCCAYVVPNRAGSVTFKELNQFLLSEGLARYKLPERLEVREELPLTPEGKVLKKALEEEIRQKLINEGMV